MVEFLAHVPKTMSMEAHCRRPAAGPGGASGSSQLSKLYVMHLGKYVVRPLPERNSQKCGSLMSCPCDKWESLEKGKDVFERK